MAYAKVKGQEITEASCVAREEEDLSLPSIQADLNPCLEYLSFEYIFLDRQPKSNQIICTLFVRITRLSLR